MTTRLALLISICALLTNCQRQTSGSSAETDIDSLSSIEFPIMIEGGTRAVYRFAKMTPRGLRYFLDTVSVNEKGIALPDSMKLTFLSPLSLDDDERESLPCIIAISVAGLWEETIFGTIDNAGQLRLHYIDDITLAPESDVNFHVGNWAAVFRSDSIEVTLSAVLAETAVGDHLSGKGKLVLKDRGNVVEQQEVLLVYDKRANIITRKQ